MTRRRIKTDVDREITSSGATKCMAYIFGAMLCLGVIVQTWPISGIVIVLGLVAMLGYIRNKRD